MTNGFLRVWIGVVAVLALGGGRAGAQDVVDLAAGGSDQRWAGTSIGGLAGLTLDKGNISNGTEPSDLIIGAPGNGAAAGHVYVVLGGGKTGDNLLSKADIILNGGAGAD